MKLFALAGAVVVLCCQLASGFMIAPSAFAGSSVVSPSTLSSCVSPRSTAPRVQTYPRVHAHTLWLSGYRGWSSFGSPRLRAWCDPVCGVCVFLQHVGVRASVCEVTRRQLATSPLTSYRRVDVPRASLFPPRVDKTMQGLLIRADRGAVFLSLIHI